jgi:hypothetical protein
MSTVQVDNLHGSSRNGGRISLQGTDHLNVNGDFTFGTDGKLVIPKGTTNERPATPTAGMIRFNVDFNVVELYTGADWVYLTQVPPDYAPLLGNPNIVRGGLLVYYDANVAASYSPGSSVLTNIIDDSVSVGSITGAILGGGFGNTIRFDGNDKITFSLPNELQNSPITFELWSDFKSHSSASGGYSYFVHVNGLDNTTGNSYFTAGQSGATNNLYAAFNGQHTNMDTSFSPAGSPGIHQLVGTWDGTIQRVYIDGIERNSRTLTNNPQNWTALASIGDDKTSTGFRGVEGAFAQFRVYNRALSAAEVEQNYVAVNGPRRVYAPAHTNNLVLYLDAGNPESYSGSGNTWNDLSGNGYDVTLTNISFQAGTTTHGGALLTDGLTGYARTGNITVPNIETISFWIFNYTEFNNTNGAMGGPSNYQSLVNQGNTYIVNLGGWTSDATNEAVHIWYGKDGGTITYTKDEAWAANNWWNMVFNWNGSSYDIWRNGVKLTAYAGNSGHATVQEVNNTYLEFFTSNGQTYDFYGLCSQILMYDTALTDQEVRDNYNSMRGRFGL